MLIGICGGNWPLSSQGLTETALTGRQGICAGKDSVAAFLVKNYGFTRLYITHSNSAPDTKDLAGRGTTYYEFSIFQNAASLLEFVTQRWQQRWVTTDIWNEGVLDVFLRRPCFLLISVDAPVSLRWQRFKDR